MKISTLDSKLKRKRKVIFCYTKVQCHSTILTNKLLSKF